MLGKVEKQIVSMIDGSEDRIYFCGNIGLEATDDINKLMELRNNLKNILKEDSQSD